MLVLHSEQLEMMRNCSSTRTVLMRNSMHEVFQKADPKDNIIEIYHHVMPLVIDGIQLAYIVM